MTLYGVEIEGRDINGEYSIMPIAAFKSKEERDEWYSTFVTNQSTMKGSGGDIAVVTPIIAVGDNVWKSFLEVYPAVKEESVLMQYTYLRIYVQQYEKRKPKEKQNDAEEYEMSEIMLD